MKVNPFSCGSHKDGRNGDLGKEDIFKRRGVAKLKLI